MFSGYFFSQFLILNFSEKITARAGCVISGECSLDCFNAKSAGNFPANPAAVLAAVESVGISECSCRT